MDIQPRATLFTSSCKSTYPSWILATFPWIIDEFPPISHQQRRFRSSRNSFPGCMRINSPHLQIEIERFANEASTSSHQQHSADLVVRKSSVVDSTCFIGSISYARFSGSTQSPWRFIRRLDGCLTRLNFDIDGDFSACSVLPPSICSDPPICLLTPSKRRFTLALAWASLVTKIVCKWKSELAGYLFGGYLSSLGAGTVCGRSGRELTRL